MAWEIFSFSGRTWLLLALTAGAFLLAIALFFGLDWDRKKVPRHVFRPTRSNLRGTFVHLPSGEERVDWKKGYNEKYQTLYLQGRKSPIPGIILPRREDIIRAAPYANVFPISVSGLWFGDPRGRVLEYIPPRVQEVTIPKEEGGFTVIQRNFQHAYDSDVERSLRELEQLEELNAARESSFEKSQKENAKLEALMESVGKMFGPALSRLSGKKGGQS